LAYHRNKIKLFTHQHGGNYGIDAAIFSEYYERKLSDVFYTWGWGSGNCKILSPPRMKFRKKSPSKRYFLYASHDAGRYLGEFKTQIFSSIVSNNYLKDAELFVKNVNHKEIIFRFKPSKREGDFIKQSFLEMDPNIKCSCNNEKFENMLSDCELFIADHLITTWLESLIMNKPTVVFTNKKYFKCRRSVEPIIKRLVDVGIVFFDPIAAAKHVNNISNDIDKWWGNENLQSVKNEFVANYAYSSHNWRLEWIDEFNTIMKKY
jgi:putative transferase (TIGR04331 family)